MRRVVLASLLFAGGLGLSGCSSLSSFERQEYQAMKTEGVLVADKEPALAAGLGLLPGGGSFYTRNYALGIVDLFLWPVSVCWDPVIAYHEAEAINYRASKAYLARLKAKQMHELDVALAGGQITQVQYLQEKRAVDSRFGD